MKPEAAIFAVLFAGLGAVGVTVAIGSALREETVVSNPYEAGLHHAEAVAAKQGPAGAPAKARVEPPCDLAVGPCSLAAGPFDVTLDLGPRPLRTMVDLSAAIGLARGGAPVEGVTAVLSFDMRGMSMGTNRRVLSPAGAGRYGGKAVLVRCPSGRKDWIATVAIEVPGEPPAAATLEFAVAE